MTKFRRLVLIVTFCLPLASICFSQARMDMSVADRDELLRLKNAIEEAVNTDDVSKLFPYLSKNFSGKMVTGDQVRSPAELKALWRKVKKTLRKGEANGKYHIEILPDSIDFHGDSASIQGRTLDDVTLGDGTRLRYQTTWTVDLERGKDGWRIKGVNSKANMMDKLTLAARLTVLKLWSPWRQFKAPGGDPDWDGDQGRRHMAMFTQP